MVAESNSASAASPKISAHKTRARKTSRSIPARVSNLDFLFFKPHFLQARPYYMKSENEKRQIWLQRFNQHACSILQDGNLRTFFRQIHERPASGGDSWNKYESCASNKYESCFSRNPEKVERLDQEQQWRTVPR